MKDKKEMAQPEETHEHSACWITCEKKRTTFLQKKLNAFTCENDFIRSIKLKSFMVITEQI